MLIDVLEHVQKDNYKHIDLDLEVLNHSLGTYENQMRIIFTAPIIGHVGDGNLHCNIVYDPNPSPKHKDPIRYV